MSDSDLKSTTATLETPPEEIEKSTASERRRMTLNMGPQHPSTHGVLRVLLELDGETVVRAYPDIGFLHTASRNNVKL
jgi:NADH-quinone oxidoreductase subunit D